MHNKDEISTIELARMCYKESERYRRRQPDDGGHCFELFHRAIANRDQQAWAAICEQYWRGPSLKATKSGCPWRGRT